MNYCPPIPKHPSIVEVEVEKEYVCTACWRGYVGTWEIKEGRFYLVNLNGRFVLEGGPLFAYWFTGVLRIPKGKLLRYVHMGFGSVFEEELHIKIEKGIVTNTRTIDNCNKEHDLCALKWANLPGGENRFPGDDEL